MKYGVWVLLALVFQLACIGEEFTVAESGVSATSSENTTAPSASVSTGAGGGQSASSSASQSSVSTGGGDGGGGQTSSTTSTASVGGDGGGGGDASSSVSAGGSGGGCDVGEKDCDGTCVDVDDPDFGCTPTECAPCDLVGATAACQSGQCVIGECLDGFDDCDNEVNTGCETDLMNDLDHCGACNDSCSVTGADCAIGICTGPCGAVPETGLHACWVYGTLSVPANQFVGLAGGVADPDQGETIQNEFLDPWCVNPDMGEPFVLCDLGDAQPNWDIQFRGGLHISPGSGTITGTWDCGTTTCGGEVYIYLNKEEVGSLVEDVAEGTVSTIAHFNPPGLLNAKVTAP